MKIGRGVPKKGEGDHTAISFLWKTDRIKPEETSGKTQGYTKVLFKIFDRNGDRMTPKNFLMVSSPPYPGSFRSYL